VVGVVGMLTAAPAWAAKTPAAPASASAPGAMSSSESTITAPKATAPAPSNTTPAGIKPAPAASKTTATPTKSASVSNPAKAPTAAATTPSKTTPAPAAPKTALAKPGATNPAAKTNARTAPTAGSAGAAGSTPPGASKTGTPGAATSAAHVDEHVTYHYNTLGRRDPFQSLIDGEFVGNDVGGDAPPDVGGLKVVGIVWGDSDKFALVEDGRGNSHVLRQGDKVMNGFVESLKRDAIIVSMTVDGETQSITVPLTRKGDKDATH
jgi:hypothetical protein